MDNVAIIAAVVQRPRVRPTAAEEGSTRALLPLIVIAAPGGGTAGLGRLKAGRMIGNHGHPAPLSLQLPPLDSLHPILDPSIPIHAPFLGI